MKKSLCVWLAIAALAPVSLSAQTADEGLAHLVPNLLLQGIRLPGAEDPGAPHAGHFTLGNPTLGSQPGSLADPGAIAAVSVFGDRLRAQFGNVPLGSSTGGFTYSFDESSGLYTRTSESFGPSFTERAATIGRRKLSLGFNYQHASFDTFSGEDLRDGSITFFLPHTDCCSPDARPPSPQNPGFESDVMQAALRLQATTDTVALFANYGLTERLDIGVAIPITRVDLEANVQATIVRLSSAGNPRVHTFVQGEDVIGATFTSEGSATGIGDIVLRTKYNFLQAGNTGVAAALDLRLPTGEADDLLGVGATQAKVFLVLSTGTGRVLPHVNVGFTVSGEGDAEAQALLEPFGVSGVSDEFNYAGGVEIVAHPRLTLLADLLGRTLFDAGQIELETKTFAFSPVIGPSTAPLLTSRINPVTGQPYRQLALRSGNLSLAFGAVGLKFNAGTNLLVTGSVLFPFTDAGLRDRLAFALGVDYAF